MYGIPGNAVLSGFMEKEEMDRQVKPTTRLLHMHTPERRVKASGADVTEDHTITPTNSSNNLQALRQPGFFSSDTEVDDLHDLHDTHNSTPDHQASSPNAKARFYFPGPLPHEPVGDETVRILSYAPPHPEARGVRERGKEGERLERERGGGGGGGRGRERIDRGDIVNQIDGEGTPQISRAATSGSGAVSVNTSDKEPGRDYSRRFYVPDVPLSIPAAARPKSPEKSPPPIKKGNMATKMHSTNHSSKTTSSSIAPAEDVSTPVILSKAPPHPFAKRIDSNASISSEVDLAAPSGTTGSTSSSRATVEARFQVRVPGVAEGQEVRVSGNDTVLGAWDVTKSVPMKQSTEHPDLWYTNVELPVLQHIKYRYLVVEKVQSNSSSGESINIIRWETMLHPRYCRFSLPGGHEAVDNADREHEEKCHDYRENGVFGENERGETSSDDGWLVGVSELHLRLLPPGAENDPPIQIASLPSNYSRYSVKLKPFAYGSKQKEVSCSEMKVKKMDRQRGDCDFLCQTDQGCYFNQETQGLTFWTQAQNFDKIGFTVDIYAHSEEEEGEEAAGKRPTAVTGPGASSRSATETPPTLAHVGRTSILPQQYLVPEKSQGKIVLTVFSPELLSIGTMTFSYLLIHPVKESPTIHMCKYSFATHWKKHKRALDIGHRGLGDSYHLHGELKPSVTENTIASLKQAGAHGADYVEFDVQLTKDLQLVVYHDFRVVTTLAKQGFFSGELYEMLVKDLTLSQLQSLKLEHSSVLSQHNRHLNLSESVRSASQSSGGETSHDSDSSLETYWGTGYKEDLPERKTFPLLKLLFKKIPRNIGFNIEIKYPNPCKDRPSTQIEYFDRNLMADYVLKTVYRCSNRRKIMFSCFDADMCTVLRRKQPKYPVLFLTTNLLPKYGVPFDVREQSIYDAMMHAKTEKLLGVDMNSTQLLAQPELVKEMEKRKLVLFTWGHDNNDVTNIQLQRDWGVAAVIYDCINMLIPPQKTIFEVEEEEEKAAEIQRWQERRRASFDQKKVK